MALLARPRAMDRAVARAGASAQASTRREDGINRRIKTIVGGGVLTFALAPGTASAVSIKCSFQGDDYSTNSSSGKTVYACDEEDDGHDVSADFVRTGTSAESHVIDAYGNGCSSTPLSTVVYKHRAVELLPFTEAHEPWVYPT